MILYFANRNLEILGQASTFLPKGLAIIDDQKTEDIDTGVASLDVTLSFRGENRLEIEQMTQEGNFVFCSSGEDAECYTIITAVTSRKKRERSIQCEDAGLDLLNEIAPAYTAQSAMSIADYIALFAGDSGFEVGVNEIPEKTRTLSWDGDATVTERLRSVATQFDNAEISYSFDIENLAVRHMYINVWEKRGTDIGQQLRLDRDIDDIRITSTIANLITGVLATGGIPEGQNDPITLDGYTYDDGDMYVSGGRLLSRDSARRWSRLSAEDGLAYIVGKYSYETTNQAELFNRAKTYLTTYREPQYNYEVDILRGLESARIGDRVDIVDDEGEVYLSARILKLVTSECYKSKTATLGEYLIKTSGLSDQVMQLASDFQQLAGKKQTYTWIAYADDDQGTGISLSPYNKTYIGICVNQDTETPDITDPSVYSWVAIEAGNVLAVDMTVTSSAGTLFVTSLITTTLTAHVYLNGAELNSTQIAEIGTIKWYNQANPGTAIGTGTTLTITNSADITIIAQLEV